MRHPRIIIVGIALAAVAAAVRAAWRNGSTASRAVRRSAPVGSTGRSFLSGAASSGRGRGCPSVISAILLLYRFLSAWWPSGPRARVPLAGLVSSG